MLIAYCEKCGFRVPAEDIKAGIAIEVEPNRYMCAKCAPAQAAPSQPAKPATKMIQRTSGEMRAANPTSAPARTTPNQIPALPSAATPATTPPRSGAAHKSHAPSAKPAAAKNATAPRWNTSIIVAGIGIALLFAGILIALSGKSDTRVSEKQTPQNTSPAETPTQPKVSSAPTPNRVANVPAPPPPPVTVNTPPAAQAQPETSPAISASERAQQAEKEMEAMRADRATKLLAEAQEYLKGHADDPWTYSDKLTAVASTYRSTPAAAEAAKLLAELKLPPGGRPIAQVDSTPNMVVDCGFESGNWGAWGAWGGAAIVNESQNARSGSFCLRLDPKESGSGQVFKGLQPNTNYILTGWMRVSAEGDNIFLGIKDYGGAEKSEKVSSLTWQKTTLKFTTGSSNTTAQVYFWKPDVKGFVYGDDVTVLPEGAMAVPDLPSNEQWKGAINLVPLIDPAKDTVAGTWRVQDNNLVAEDAGFARIEIPYQPPEEYDYRVTFSRPGKGADLQLICSHNGKGFAWVMGCAGNSTYNVELVNSPNGNKTVSNAQPAVQPGRTHTATVQVRKDGVCVYYDDRAMAQVRDYNMLSARNEWRLRDESLLGVGAHDGQTFFQKIEVIPITGTGKAMRGSLPQIAVATKPAAGTAAPAEISSDAKNEYEKVLADVYAMLLKNAVPSAVAKLEKAKTDQALASMQNHLEQDIAFAKEYVDFATFLSKGAAALSDKRTFTLRKADGKETQTGKGTNNAIIGFGNDTLELEQDLGGGKAKSRVSLEQLTPGTRLNLAKVGAPAEGAELKLAFAALLVLSSGSQEVSASQVKLQLESARKKKFAEDRIAHLEGRLEFLEREQNCDIAFKKLDVLLGSKKHEDALKFLEKFSKDFAGTQALKRLQPVIEQRTAELNAIVHPLKPGIYASFFHKDNNGNRYAEYVTSRVDNDLEIKAGLPNGVRNDAFSIKYRGVLHLDRDGRYGFWAHYDDHSNVYIDGKRVIDQQWDKVGEVEVDLRKGDHDFKVEWFQDGGGFEGHIQWRLVGGFDLQPIPASVLFHDPKLAEKYQKD